jgi:hypothetical protein
MKTLWDAGARDELAKRLENLRPDSQPAWGRLNASRMLTHLVDALRMATGDLAVQPKRLPIRFSPLKQLIIYGPPFKKNAPTAPELLTRNADENWEAECSDLRRMMDAFASRPPDAKLPNHPAFGKLSRRAWGVLGYKHIDHHFKQFGV